MSYTADTDPSTHSHSNVNRETDTRIRCLLRAGELCAAAVRNSYRPSVLPRSRTAGVVFVVRRCGHRSRDGSVHALRLPVRDTHALNRTLAPSSHDTSAQGGHYQPFHWSLASSDSLQTRDAPRRGGVDECCACRTHASKPNLHLGAIVGVTGTWRDTHPQQA